MGTAKSFDAVGRHFLHKALKVKLISREFYPLGLFGKQLTSDESRELSAFGSKTDAASSLGATVSVRNSRASGSRASGPGMNLQ